MKLCRKFLRWRVLLFCIIVSPVDCNWDYKQDTREEHGFGDAWIGQPETPSNIPPAILRSLHILHSRLTKLNFYPKSLWFGSKLSSIHNQSNPVCYQNQSQSMNYALIRYLFADFLLFLLLFGSIDSVQNLEISKVNQAPARRSLLSFPE